MTKYQCMECFEWKHESELDFNEFLPEENHRETICKSCADAYETEIVEQLLPSDEYWAQREDDKSQPPLDDSDPFAVQNPICKCCNASQVDYIAEDMCAKCYTLDTLISNKRLDNDDEILQLLDTLLFDDKLHIAPEALFVALCKLHLDKKEMI